MARAFRPFTFDCAFPLGIYRPVRPHPLGGMNADSNIVVNRMGASLRRRPSIAPGNSFGPSITQPRQPAISRTLTVCPSPAQVREQHT
jgi:hypothetical protein